MPYTSNSPSSKAPSSKFSLSIITCFTASLVREYQQCMCCQQHASRLICDACASCIKTYGAAVFPDLQGQFIDKNSQSFINLRPDIARRLPTLKQHAITAIGPHKDILLTLISRFKYTKQTLLAMPLGEMLCRQVLHNYTTDGLPELILPVPIHFIKRMVRGFNQTELLGQHISDNLNIPVSPKIVTRTSYAKPQAGKTGKQRRLLSHTLFKVKQPEALKQLSHIALLDDVITTGSTMLQLIKAIKKANPDIRIDLWSLSVST